ncbi:MAG TPA: hypothetical protein VFE62_15065, partial [Gemmataceae bacterium]|nr:hypothetical protein [Gemmataceae bacterium]
DLRSDTERQIARHDAVAKMKKGRTVHAERLKANAAIEAADAECARAFKAAAEKRDGINAVHHAKLAELTKIEHEAADAERLLIETAHLPEVEAEIASLKDAIKLLEPKVKNLFDQANQASIARTDLLAKHEYNKQSLGDRHAMSWYLDKAKEEEAKEAEFRRMMQPVQAEIDGHKKRIEELQKQYLIP